MNTMSGETISRREVLALGAVMLAAEQAAAAQQPAVPETQAGGQPLIDRAFLRFSEGLVHYRSAGQPRKGQGTALYLAHAGPGSSRAFEGMLPSFGKQRFAFAPDMLGNGDSAAPARDNVDIAYYVDCAMRIMDELKLERVDFYGSHTGAQIGCQLAVQHPGRVRRLVLDGIPMFSDAFKAQLLEHYAPQVTPDDFGGHLAWAWNFVRDQSLYWPYFDRQAANRLANAVASADQLHLAVTDVVKALGTYHIAYHAAFAQDLRPLLPQLRCPVLIMASERDPLSIYLDEASALVPHALKMRWPRNSTAAERITAVEQFLAG
jgi:pimeloyl-ACP methyl ester carboxylesterase